MTKRDLAKLRKRLPGNHGILIQNSLKADKSYSLPYISMVLHGTKTNDDIIAAAIIVAEKHEQKLRELAKAARGEEKLDRVKFNLQK